MLKIGGATEKTLQFRNMEKTATGNVGVVRASMVECGPSISQIVSKVMLPYAV